MYKYLCFASEVMNTLCSFSQQSTLDRKKKNFSFSRKFPFMKSKDDKSEDGSDAERKYINSLVLFSFVSFFPVFPHSGV